MKRKRMKRKRIWSFLMVLSLTVASVQAPVHAGADNIRTESAALTDENRYNPEYYREPEEIYPAVQSRAYREDGAEQTLEEYIVEALENFEAEIDVSAFQIPSDSETAFATFRQITNNHPELFYVGNGVGWSYSPGSNTVLSYTVTYLGTPDEIRLQREQLETVAEQVAAQVDTSLEDYQQALIVHDYLVQNCEYDYENYLSGNVPEISHTSYGCLVSRFAVCDGYSNAFMYIMKGKLGIPCEIVSSDAMAHAWNMINIGGEWYHVDATWDDPTWDCIGRVCHNYFLNSDNEISCGSPDAPLGEQEGRNHYSWGAGNKASSTIYDNVFWENVTSAICYYNNAWYYSKYQPDGNDLTQAVKLVKRDGTQLFGGSEDIVYSTPVWSIGGGRYSSNSYMYLARAYNSLYFNTPAEICRVNADGNVEKFYIPQDLEGTQICGFTVRGNEFWYAPQGIPSSGYKQEDIRKFSLPEISGISAEDVRGEYTGEPFKIAVTGIQEGDVIEYALEDGEYGYEQPEMKNAGTYQVLYRVKRDGFQDFYGSARVEIAKAAPSYTVPEEAAGSSGDTLASVELPDGFEWEEPETVLRGEGVHTYPATYTPEDTENYQTVSVDIEVEVTCPGHQCYIVVTTAPTESAKGEAIYTCLFCGHSYTDEIDELPPEIIDIDVPDVMGVYNESQSYTIQVMGKQEGDIVQYALKDGQDDVVYGDEQPKLKDAGTYEVLYKVMRAGYQLFEGSVRIEIARAKPEYTLPRNLKGISGAALSSVQLPEGFLWQDADTKLSKTGYQKFYVAYRPEDQVNYEIVTDIEVDVQVTCPNHQYVSQITKEPTETEKGVRTKTCELCGKSFTEDIAELSPARPDKVSNLNVTGQAADSLSFSWQGAQNIGYRLKFYRGSGLVSEVYATGNTYTYKGLKAATVYTLEVTPYRTVSGRRVYAESGGSIKTATAPAKAKLSKVKRTGKSKVKLTWKKAAGASGYEVSMRKGNGKYKTVKIVGNGKTLSFTKTKLGKKKTSYSFRIRAYVTVDNNTKVYGAYSNVKKVK